MSPTLPSIASSICVDQPVGQPQRVALRQALPRAELVVDRLPADAGGLGDVGQRDRRPVAGQQQVPHAVEDRVAQQDPRRLGVRDALRSARRSPRIFARRALGQLRHDRATSTISKSDLAAPQSGQLQSSGMSSQRVPGAMPSSGQPLRLVVLEAALHADEQLVVAHLVAPHCLQISRFEVDLLAHRAVRAAPVVGDVAPTACPPESLPAEHLSPRRRRSRSRGSGRRSCCATRRAAP